MTELQTRSVQKLSNSQKRPIINSLLTVRFKSITTFMRKIDY
jgi:hypothetical protein